MNVKLPKLLDYQENIIKLLDRDDIKFVTFLKSRQSGGTFLNKILVIKWALENKNVKIGFITPKLKLARTFHKELAKSLDKTNLVVDVNKTDLVIEFINGSYVQFISAESAEGNRGLQFHYLIIDEAAFMKSSLFDDIIRYMVLIIGRKVMICSTPCNNDGFFHKHYYMGLDDNFKEYASYKISIYDNPFISEKEIADIRKSVPELTFKRELLAEFIDGTGSVFSNFKDCINEKPELNGRYYAGIDWAKENDYTVLTILNDKNQMVLQKRWTGLDYTVQVKLVAKILNDYNPIITLSEENNIGSVINEILKKEYQGHIKKVTLNNNLKKEIIERLIVGFENNYISILNDKDLLNELGWFGYEYNPNTQIVKYKGKDGLHDDTVISLAYAYYATIKNKKINFI